MKATRIKRVSFRKSDGTWHVSFKNSNKNMLYKEGEMLPKTVRDFVLANCKNPQVYENNIITYSCEE